MLRNALYLAAAVSAIAAPAAAQAHGEGEQGASMGPVAFLWPADRPWSASEDNKAPCGSVSGPTTRADFPLVGGAVALSIADDAWNVVFRIAYGNNPTTQSAFNTFVPARVDAIEPGHQCYKAPTIANVAEGTNATIQMEYWSNDSGKDESFFACADITLVGATAFADTIPCFNVTASEFEAPQSTETVIQAAPEQPASDNGLSTGAKAGIAVGSILGASAIIGVAVFFAFRKRSKPADSESTPYMSQTKGAQSVESVPAAARQ
ncbi:hypothetical protein TWF173_011091 [Orbilia oligospora]|uniref:Copper acquisition factor BIM1-like domain-containing protein n=2 Tax=Orbilia oligospora TaxID=2813651 RepID=G1X7Q9_ARTOA|nr:hypothetical protein AOL_s00054g976 [Orbilia oligospora ATCC 24927]EGX50890.1 hypothetical protein AOL_s00054g976 [Orbilia oligospora ATCC 24927]KAF3284099.1 hypothetical protein TWF970_011320 [Orbilia oligospora]KAF3317436.1 hypothetical protein TWF173_011091 [Orbilia oligospora]